MLKKRILFLLFFVVALSQISAQEDNPFVAYDVPAQNLLKYNRFLLNPTFSTVREDKSYINLQHRNQSVQFNDNNQNYFLSYSGRINDRTGLGLSLYTQREGLLSNYGVLANYAYGVKLSDKSNLTFGANASYYSSGFDEGRASTVVVDPLLAGLQDQNLLSFQPALNLSYGSFDVGVFAENLFDYNLKSSETITEFQDKTFSGHLQYTHQFTNDSGIFEEARLMPLARARKVGEEEVTLGGSLILDLPKLGWLQAGYDTFYGAAAGIGFNLNQRVSLGYTMEKGLSSNFDNFGVTHEISVAYAFTPNLTEDRVMLEEEEEDSVEEDFLKETEDLASADEIEELRQKLAENDIIIQELMFRQDSLEANRQSDLERRFNMVMRMVRNETNGENPELEKRAAALFNGEEETQLTSNFGNTNTNSSVDGGAAYANNQNKVNKPSATSAQRNASKNQAQNQDNLASSNYNNKSGSSKIAQDNLAGSNYNNNLGSSTIAQDKIITRRFKDLPNTTDGYYVVANVYKGDEYLNKFINKLSDKGLNAGYIENPNDGLKYAYLKRYNSLEEAQAAIKTNENGYTAGPTWIMNVDNAYTNEAYADNVNKLQKKSSKYEADVLRKNVVVKDKIATTNNASTNYDIVGLGSGYYLIANVFAVPENANKFVSLLNSLGLSASYFINPKNNYRYVYLRKHDSWSNALLSYYTKLNNAYDDKMWIMRVKSEQIV